MPFAPQVLTCLGHTVAGYLNRLGSLNCALGLIPLGRLHLRPLQQYIHSLSLTNQFTPPHQSDQLVLSNLRSSSGSFSVASDSRHSSQSQTHTRLF